MKFRQRIANFFRDRYGVDKFGIVLVWVALILMIVNSFVHSLIIYIVQFLFIIYWAFRCFSKNIPQRQKENQMFERILGRFTSFFKLQRMKWKDRKTHVFTKCPQCKVNIRLPKRRGEHIVKCPKCSKKFNFICK